MNYARSIQPEKDIKLVVWNLLGTENAKWAIRERPVERSNVHMKNGHIPIHFPFQCSLSVAVRMRRGGHCPR